MVPHYSGTTLDAQARYANGAKSILENYLSGKEQEAQNIIVGLGKYETKACECLSIFSRVSLAQPYRVRRPTLSSFGILYIFLSTCCVVTIKTKGM